MAVHNDVWKQDRAITQRRQQKANTHRFSTLLLAKEKRGIVLSLVLYCFLSSSLPIRLIHGAKWERFQLTDACFIYLSIYLFSCRGFVAVVVVLFFLEPIVSVLAVRFGLSRCVSPGCFLQPPWLILLFFLLSFSSSASNIWPAINIRRPDSALVLPHRYIFSSSFSIVFDFLGLFGPDLMQLACIAARWLTHSCYAYTPGMASRKRKKKKNACV